MNYKFLLTILAIIFTSCTKNETSIKQDFNKNWQFVISDAFFEEIQSENQWEPVSLPHTPVIENKIMDGQWQGLCWYKKEFKLPTRLGKQRYIMRFEAAMNVSKFWINGEEVAKHIGGYLPTVFDFTDYAKAGSNTIYVQLDNRDNKITGPKPINRLDFNMYGGLYRDAFLLIKNPLHITDPILADKTASGGIFVTYPKVSKNQATVKIQTHITNSSNDKKHFKIVNELYYNNQLVNSTNSEIQTLDKNSENEFISLIKVDQPNLWSPKMPNRYKLITKIIENKKVIDQQETTIGIRNIAFNGHKFLINGEEMFLRGVNRHQDYPYQGYALSNRAQYRDAYKIKSAGFDYVRLSHYPHSPAFMDACDEIGLIVLDAILGWQYYSRDSLFQNQVYKTAHNLIRRDRNHPCVYAWEVSLNESWMDEYFIDSLTAIAHAEYPGNQCFTAGWQSYGYDIYLQARQHRLGHYKESSKPYNVSEYGDWEYYAMNAGLNQDSWNGLKQADRSSRQLLANGEIHLLQQALNIQEAHNDNFNIPAHADGYWLMFDYNRGYSPDLETSGIASIDRIPKFSYYFYQSQRNATENSNLFQSGPMVKIASYWTTESPLTIRIFSNANEVELLLNGKSLGKQKPDENKISNNLNHPPFTFKLKKYIKGTLEAKAYINGKLVANDKVISPEIPSKIELILDKSGYEATTGVNDVLFVYACIKDKNGTTVPVNNKEITFKVEGDAQFVSPKKIDTEAGIAAALIKIGDLHETIKLKATGKQLKSDELEISFK